MNECSRKSEIIIGTQTDLYQLIYQSSPDRSTGRAQTDFSEKAGEGTVD